MLICMTKKVNLNVKKIILPGQSNFNVVVRKNTKAERKIHVYILCAFCYIMYKIMLLLTFLLAPDFLIASA